MSIEIVWDDGDLKMIVIEAANGRFRAQAEAYAGAGELRRIADIVAGFPSGQKDVREVIVGTAKLRFFSREETIGHSMVELKFSGGTDEYPERAHFYLAVEASAIAEWVAALRSVGDRRERPAVLRAGREP